MKLMKNALVILAGGKGARIGGATPKQFKKYGQYNFIEYLLNNIQLNCFDLNQNQEEKLKIKSHHYLLSLILLHCQCY